MLCFDELSANFSIQPDDLRASGVELVLANTLYAIIGAVSLEKGGLVATQMARERILEPLGIKSS